MPYPLTMTPHEILNLTADLIRFQSFSGSEHQVTHFVADNFAKRGWTVERLPVVDGRENLLVSFGIPRVLFTTHLDIVDAPESLFEPKLEGEKLTGRGACDAKGIAATMIGACAGLLAEGANDFGILLVVGEELDGIGAQRAAHALQGRGIAYLVNGEPTEGKIMRSHKGALGVTIEFVGRACHSGYPELGEDANEKLVKVCSRLMEATFGLNDEFGAATVNLGILRGGTMGNIVSPSASLSLLVRTVTENDVVLEKIKSLAPEASSIRIGYDVAPVRLMTVPGFSVDVAKYCTDIPYFAPLGVPAVLYGPGSIHRAHTDFEFITAGEIEDACAGYRRIFSYLHSLSR